MQILLAPDSFKGTLSSSEVCAILTQAIREVRPDAAVTALPIADGGEGTTDAYLQFFSGERVTVCAHSPLLRHIKAAYGILPDGTAIVETAAASGIAIEPVNDALRASSFGTGELIKSALDRGCRHILLGLGGSATTDGGTGLLCALGARFLDSKGRALAPGGGALENLAAIDLSDFDARLRSTSITALCDVENPLFGETGAAAVFAPQKGADAAKVKTLDHGLRRLAAVTAQLFGKDVSLAKGAGAAGGLGFACLAFLGAALQPGIDCILDAADFASCAARADLIITGEGKMDLQSLMGKAPFGVAKRSGGTRVVALVGLLDAPQEAVQNAGIAAVYETNPKHLPFEAIRKRAKEDALAAARVLCQAELRH